MATKGIAAAIKSISPKKKDLRKAFDALQSYSSSFASFTLQWKDLEDHISSIERSIETRFKELESKTLSAAPAPDDEPEADPRPELKALCSKMDGMGLQSFIIANRNDLDAIRRELNRAIRSAPDPAALVLDAMGGFYPLKSKGEKDMVLQTIRNTCVKLLEKLQVIAPEIKPLVRDRAKKLALEWKGKIKDGGENALEVLGFLQVLLSYGLVSEFKADELLDLLVFISRRKQTLELIKSLGLVESVPDLIRKLSNKGKQLDAVKFVYAFNLLDKYPPVPLLKAYLKDSKKSAQELRKKRNNSIQSQHDATSKEIASLRAVVKAVEEYKLEAEYSCENLQKRISQLEQQKVDKKRAATTFAASNLKNQKQQLQQSNKRPRLSNTVSIPANSFPSVVHNPPHLGLTDRASYLGLAGSYDLTTTGSLYDRAGPGFLGGNPTPPTSYLYSSEPLASSASYDRPVTYGGYSLSGLPTYGSSHYP